MTYTLVAFPVTKHLLSAIRPIGVILTKGYDVPYNCG